MISLYHNKYPDGKEMMVLRSLVYFQDAEDQSNPVMLVSYDWNDIKKYILEETNKYIKQSTT